MVSSLFNQVPGILLLPLAERIRLVYSTTDHEHAQHSRDQRTFAAADSVVLQSCLPLKGKNALSMQDDDTKSHTQGTQT